MSIRLKNSDFPRPIFSSRSGFWSPGDRAPQQVPVPHQRVERKVDVPPSSLRRDDPVVYRRARRQRHLLHQPRWLLLHPREARHILLGDAQHHPCLSGPKPIFIRCECRYEDHSPPTSFIGSPSTSMTSLSSQTPPSVRRVALHGPRWDQIKVNHTPTHCPFHLHHHGRAGHHNGTEAILPWSVCLPSTHASSLPSIASTPRPCWCLTTTRHQPDWPNPLFASSSNTSSPPFLGKSLAGVLSFPESNPQRSPPVHAGSGSTSLRSHPPRSVALSHLLSLDAQVRLHRSPLTKTPKIESLLFTSGVAPPFFPFMLFQWV